MAIYEHRRPAGFEVDMLNAAVQRKATGALPERREESFGPKDGLRILAALQSCCEEGGSTIRSARRRRS